MSVRAVRVEAEGLTHRYGRRRTHIHTLSFAFDGPGAVSVTGPNGSGKSTLLRIVAGLLRPSSGRLQLTLEGRSLPPNGRRLAVGLATPDLSFYEEFSARENLTFAARAHGLADAARAAAAALDEVGLAQRADDRVAAYSSGMKQRLRIAFAVLHDPAVLLLDEPGSHLDDHGRGVVRAVVERHAARGLVLIATNDPAESALATRGVALDA